MNTYDMCFKNPAQTEWLKIFPEGASIVQNKIKDLLDERERLKQELRAELRKGCYSLAEIILIVDLNKEKLKKIDKELSRLKGYLGEDYYRDSRKYVSVEEIKSKNSIVDIFYLLCPDRKLRKSGKNFSALCPLHPDKFPSFFLYPYTNSFYCFGCNEGGDVIDLVMKVKEVSFKEAVNYLTGR